MNDKFNSEVAQKIQHYVYRLIDPRNGETFYVGRGQNNRVFDHARGELTDESGSQKMSRIREIKLSGLKVSHVIHRHGMDKPTAKDVEAALIEAYPGLTNIMGGDGNNDFGVMHSSEIIKKYSARIAIFEHKALLISVNRSASERSLYEATRSAWKINLKKAEQAEVILPTVHGLIVGAFFADQWLPATTENFPGKETIEGRYGFVGSESPVEISKLYVGKRIPDEYRKRGASNPIRYTWD
tara:strand:+ start:3377 stop:4099 length:723 start_codon:yes stop_codon:yes gene_type:complete